MVLASSSSRTGRDGPIPEAGRSLAPARLPRLNRDRHLGSPVIDKLRVLLVDQSVDLMDQIRRRIAARFPSVETTQYDAEQRGSPGSGFRWGLYDAAIMAAELGHQRGAIEWLAKYRSCAGFPPVIVVAETGGVEDAVRAMQAGAVDFLLRADASEDRLHRALTEASRKRSRGTAGPPASAGEDRTFEIARQLSEAATEPDESGYEFLRLIGHGGMSSVYLAKRMDDEALIVLKLIEGRFMEDGELRARFLQEAELAARIDSPHVVDVFDYGLINSSGFISMEFFPRGDLKHRTELGLGSDEHLEIMTQIASGLDAIARAGIVHRDLKPANVMFRFDGSLAIADFGIAKRINSGEDFTTQGRILGTPHYMSPEQVHGADIDHRSDLFSLGVMFYELLTGRKPFEAPSLTAILYQIINEAPPPCPVDCVTASR